MLDTRLFSSTPYRRSLAAGTGARLGLGYTLPTTALSLRVHPTDDHLGMARTGARLLEDLEKAPASQIFRGEVRS